MRKSQQSYGRVRETPALLEAFRQEHGSRDFILRSVYKYIALILVYMYRDRGMRMFAATGEENPEPACCPADFVPGAHAAPWQPPSLPTASSSELHLLAPR